MAQDTVANFNSVFFKSCGSVNSTMGPLKNTNTKLGEKRCIQTEKQDKTKEKTRYF